MIGIINYFIVEYKLVPDKGISFASFFRVLDIANGDNYDILIKEVTGDMIGLTYCITKKYTLGIILVTYDKL